MEEEKKAEIQEGLFLYEDAQELSDEKRKPKAQTKLFLFSLADEWYAVDIKGVLEVSELPTITRVPGLPDFILGVSVMGGNIISVTDPKILFGLAQTQGASKKKILIIRAAGKTTGFLVDSVGKPIDFPLDSIQRGLSTLPKIKADCIIGEAKLEDGRLATILNLEKIMAAPELQFE